jgi:hypothetical protein
VHDALTTTGDLKAWLAATHPGLDQPEPGPGDLDASGRYATRCAASPRWSPAIPGPSPRPPP